MGQSERTSLPDTDAWLPRDASKKLEAAFSEECKGVEQRLIQALQHEQKFAIDNFDSGLPFEAHVREELRPLLPRRYMITLGHILDRHGKSAGKCDFVVFNDLWFSPVKSSRQPANTLLPIEGVYAVGEIKQTLTSNTLDEAMEKLIKCHRLDRPRTHAHRIVENRESCPCPHGMTSPLFSFILAGKISPDQSFQSLIERFVDINKKLNRLEVVRVLCVLGEGTVAWGFRDPLHGDEIRPALFVEADLFHPIFPVYSPAIVWGSLLSLVQLMHLSMFHTVLGPEDLSQQYSEDVRTVKIPLDRARTGHGVD